MRQYHVQFFGDSPLRAWVSAKTGMRAWEGPQGAGDDLRTAQKIPKKASKNDKGAKKPPPLPQQRSSEEKRRSSEEKRRSSELSSVADKARGGGGDASGNGAQGDSDEPDWVNEQAEQLQQRRSRKRSSDSDSDSDQDDSPAASSKRARGGEEIPVVTRRYGAPRGQGSPVGPQQKLPPGVSPESFRTKQA